MWKLDELCDVDEFDDADCDVVGAESVALFDAVLADVVTVDPLLCTSAVVPLWVAVVAALVPECCDASAAKVATPTKLAPTRNVRSDLMRRARISRWVGPICGGTVRFS